ncbi:ABC transporter substrate-binding protein [Magnetospira thiophila]
MRIGIGVLVFLAHLGFASAAQEIRPVFVGLDGEFGLKNSTSAQAIEKGLRLAIAEINERGGVLGGRPLELLTLDNRSVPARGIENIKQFADNPDLVAVVGGRFSPVLLQELPIVHERKVILFDAWGSADGITDHTYQPSYSFRVSLKDQFAMPTLLRQALSSGAKKVGLLLPNTGWGRSNAAAAERYAAQNPDPLLVGTEWYNWGDQDLFPHYQRLRQAGAEALVLVANDIEGSLLVRQMAELPENERLPVMSHWGITGGHFVEACGGALEKVELYVVQTFSLFTADPEIRARVMARAKEMFGIERIEDVDSPVGFGHAYDIVHLLAQAIEAAGTAEREKVRDALENLSVYQGLVRRYDRPFSATDHDALELNDVFVARYLSDGTIRPVQKQ